jgi:alanyl-tRNA synthetase
LDAKITSGKLTFHGKYAVFLCLSWLNREMGPTGPCGPCTEIHYDRLGGRDASALVNADRPDVIEIWNNVFIQFNREADASLKELPSKHVDTGMGLERLTSILQNKDSNYDTDVFTPIFDAIQKICGCRPYQGLVGAADTELIDMAYRVVADHIRTLTFAITDGAVPGSDGRGYVLRRILRRAIRYGQEMLGAPAGFFTSLVAVVVANFSDAFPELIGREEFVRVVISDEEQSFLRTLDQGCKHFKKLVGTIQSSGSTVVPGKEAHFLFCSMGFPLDLTELMAAERGLTVDTNTFNELLENDRKISEAAESLRKGLGTKDLSMEAEQTAWLQSNQVAPTDSSAKYVWHHNPEAQVVAVFKGRGGSTAGFFDSASPEDDLIGIVLDSTPFYPEAGGQIYDTGDLVFNGDHVFTVNNAQSYAGYIVHVGKLVNGPISVGTKVTARVDYRRRALVAPNHTMTHVLNYALRKVLLDSNGGGEAVSVGQCEQKGSLVDPEKLRFDFSWNSPLTSAQIAEVQDIVVSKIKEAVPVHAEVVSLNSASQINALRKVFGERYPDPVRVISVGVPVQDLMADPTNPNWRSIAIEFCGGTHLSNTADAEDFVLVEESGIAKGVRRIVGLTRTAALAARERATDLLERLTALEQMPGGAELNAASKAIRTEVSKCPFWTVLVCSNIYSFRRLIRQSSHSLTRRSCVQSWQPLVKL